MSDRNFPPLLAAFIGFVLGALAAKLAERFCPFCRTCCCDEAECCGEGNGGSEKCCCCDDAPESPSGVEDEAPAQ